jgi:hypothetical protein
MLGSGSSRLMLSRRPNESVARSSSLWRAPPRSTGGVGGRSLGMNARTFSPPVVMATWVPVCCLFILLAPFSQPLTTHFLLKFIYLSVNKQDADKFFLFGAATSLSERFEELGLQPVDMIEVDQIMSPRETGMLM